jgi:hypothetical protein
MNFCRRGRIQYFQVVRLKFGLPFLIALCPSIMFLDFFSVLPDILFTINIKIYIVFVPNSPAKVKQKHLKIWLGFNNICEKLRITNIKPSSYILAIFCSYSFTSYCPVYYDIILNNFLKKIRDL